MDRLPIYHQFRHSTRGRILDLLRREERTVPELARALDLSENAIRSHLSSLERDGLVRTRGVRREGVGKPARIYAFAPEAEDFYPKAYDVVLEQLLTTLAGRLGPDGLEDLLREAGESAGESHTLPDGTFDERVETALALLEELGGVTELRREEGRLRIQGFSCPLASIVGEHPLACTLVAAILSRVLGVPVEESCRREGRPRCAFLASPPSGN